MNLTQKKRNTPVEEPSSSKQHTPEQEPSMSEQHGSTSNPAKNNPKATDVPKSANKKVIKPIR